MRSRALRPRSAVERVRVDVLFVRVVELFFVSYVASRVHLAERDDHDNHAEDEKGPQGDFRRRHTSGVALGDARGNYPIGGSSVWFERPPLE